MGWKHNPIWLFLSLVCIISIVGIAVLAVVGIGLWWSKQEAPQANRPKEQTWSEWFDGDGGYGSYGFGS